MLMALFSGIETGKKLSFRVRLNVCPKVYYKEWKQFFLDISGKIHLGLSYLAN